VIRFSAFLVVVAVGLLVAGVVTSKLLLVYIAIGVSGVALLALGIGAAVNWRELTGKTAQPRTVETSAQGPVPQAAVPEPVTAPAAAGAGHAGVTSAGVAPAGSGWPVTTPAPPSSPAPVGYLPATEPPPRARPPAAFTPWRDDSIQTPSAGTRQPSGSGWTSVPAQASAAEAPAPPRPTPTQPKPTEPKPTQPRPTEPKSAPPTSPQPIVKPAGPRAEPSSAAPPSGDQSPATDQPAEPASEPEPAPEPEPAGDSEPASEAASASERELTLVSGITVAASAPATSPAGPPEPDKQAADAEPAGLDPSMEVTVVPGVPRYHNARCILIRFMGDSDLDKMTLAAAQTAGCTPCRACLPDQPDKSPE
jgi:hypothetical protein